MNGEMIVIEGIEGAGKSTAMSVVNRVLTELGVSELLHTREPGGTPIAEKLRTILKQGSQDERIVVQTEVLLMYASRAQLLNNVILPALEKGVWVVSDRYDLSSFAYQGGGRQVSLDVIETLSDFCLQGFKPSLTLYIDVTPELSMQRVAMRGGKDRIESEDIEFFERVRSVYLEFAKHSSSIKTIDGSLPLDAVEQAIEQEIRQWYAQR